MAQGNENRVDVFADQYGLNIHPNGCILRFLKTRPFDLPPGAEGLPTPADEVSIVRITPEHLKMLIYLSWQGLCQHQQQQGVAVQVPQQILEATGVNLEQWQAFWNEAPPQGVVNANQSAGQIVQTPAPVPQQVQTH